jgi:formylglycine-generating enzyme required for sulfatase activity
LVLVCALALIGLVLVLSRFDRFTRLVPLWKTNRIETPITPGTNPAGVVSRPSNDRQSDLARLIEQQRTLWSQRGLVVDSSADRTAEGWPKTLVASADQIRYQHTPSGLYLPQGYSPGDELDPVDRRPLTLTREDGTEFRRIAGGKFTMGNFDGSLAPSADPAHPVMLSSFYIQTTEVTNGEIERFVQDSSTEPFADWKKQFVQLTQKIPVEKARKHPAVNISYEAARAYARARGGRLPTEAQWEYTARSQGKDFHHVWDFQNNRNNDPRALANIDSAGANALDTAPVGTYPSDVTRQGIFDLTGNVREICRDVRRPYLLTAELQVDPQFPPDSTDGDVTLVVRGGSFYSPTDFGKTTDRSEGLQRNDSAAYIGFRIVVECPEYPAKTAKPDSPAR